MCGIAGVVRTRPDDMGELAKRWLRRLAHRGPDDHGWLVDTGASVRVGTGGPPSGPARVLLLHTRLSIIDLSAAARQPMSVADDDVSIVYNGEIYNYIELRDELRRADHAFSTASDTEVILRAYLEWGSSALPRLEGMFALAIYDRRRGELHLARDPFGIKPLYYVQREGVFAFASEIPPLLDLVPPPRRIDPTRAYDYLRFGTTDHGEGSLLSAVRQVASGARVCVEVKEPDVPAQSVKYHDWAPLSGGASDGTDPTEAVRASFLRSVDLHLRSDVAVGAALSGGIDSSAVLCAVRGLRPDSELHAFSFIADDQRINEERWVDLVATHVRATVHKVYASESSLQQDFESLIVAQGEPFGGTSIYAQFCVFRRAAEVGIKVVLDGQGADELLAGYAPYAGARLASLVRQGRIPEAIGFFRRARRLPGREPLLRLMGPYLVPSSAQDRLRRLVGREFVPTWLDAAWLEGRGVVVESPQLGGRREALRAALRRSLEKGLPYLLRYEDRNSMHHSVESRVPFLLPRFAELLMCLPEQELVADDGTSKAVFRRAMRGTVPDAILDRKDKIGFETPELRWLVGSRRWVEETLMSEVARRMPIWRHDVLMHQWEQLGRGAIGYDGRVWRWLNFVRWVESVQGTFDA